MGLAAYSIAVIVILEIIVLILIDSDNALHFNRMLYSLVGLRCSKTLAVDYSVT